LREAALCVATTQSHWLSTARFAHLAMTISLKALAIRLGLGDERQAKRMGIPIKRLLILALPSLLMVVSFYILAVHMHIALGGWPKQIGETGFSRSLVIHSALTTDYFGIVLLTTILLCPPIILVCWLVRRWRSAVPYLLAHCGFFIAGMIVMHLAPAQFLDWWWD
jgi:hypothetical protein